MGRISKKDLRKKIESLRKEEWVWIIFAIASLLGAFYYTVLNQTMFAMACGFIALILLVFQRQATILRHIYRGALYGKNS